MTYEVAAVDVPQLVSGCSHLFGTPEKFILTMAAAPLAGQVVKVGYAGAQITTAVNTVPPIPAPVASLPQSPGVRWKKPLHGAGVQRWIGAASSMLKTPSPTPILMPHIILANTSGAEIEPHAYSLWSAEGDYPTVAASLTIALAGANNDVVWTAREKGAIGNAITMAYVNPGSETASESVPVTGSAISVTLRSVSSVLSTAAQVKAAVAAHAVANGLVSSADAGGNDGSGVVIALAATALASGVGDTAVRLPNSSNDFPLYDRAQGDPSIPIDTLVLDASGLTLPGGVTFRSGGIHQTSPGMAQQSPIEDDKALIMAPILSLAAGVAKGTTFSCCLRIEVQGQELDACTPITIEVTKASAHLVQLVMIRYPNIKLQVRGLWPSPSPQTSSTS